MLPALTGYGWNSVAHRYYSADDGRFVPQSEIRDALESVMDVSALRMNNLSERLQNGTISLADWQTGMMQQIKTANVASAALANGGWGNMTQADWGFVGSEIKEQYQYLRNFASQIANGEQPLDGRFLVRTDLYGDAPNGTYWDMTSRSMVAGGMDEERRILESGAEHCDGCLEQAALGWQPIGTLDPIGDEECQVRCRCEFAYRNSNDPESETA